MSISELALWRYTAKAADPGKELEKRNTEPPYIEVPKNHAAMHRAVLQARKTVGAFITALRHPAPDQKDFEIKKPFIQNGQIEHIWLSDVQLVGDRVQALVDTQPLKLHG